MKTTTSATFLMLILGVGPAVADTIYQYRQPGGGLLFTDKDLMPQDYTLLDIRKGWQYNGKQITEHKRDQYDHHIEYAARSFLVDPALIKAVIHAESNFESSAVSRAGAEGLMQLMPQTADFLQVYDSFDPKQNIMGGARYLRYLMGRFNEVELILAAYNAGEGNVRRYGGIPPFPETRGYVTKVLEFLPKYEQQFAQTTSHNHHGR